MNYVKNTKNRKSTIPYSPNQQKKRNIKKNVNNNHQEHNNLLKFADYNFNKKPVQRNQSSIIKKPDNTNLPIINTNEIINKKLISSYFILFIIIFSLILISIRYIGKKICKLKEKKRLNHINDFDYSKHEHFNINNKSSYQLNLLMEMKGLIYS